MMTGLSALWLPILLSAVFVFIVSSIIHMFTPWHKGEYPGLPREDDVMNALRPFNIPPGDYMVPRAADMKAMKSPEFLEKLKKGPVAIMTVIPNGPPAMGKSLVLWFIYSLVIGVFVGYVAGRASPLGASYLHVFRFAGVAAFLGYAGALAQFSIWYQRAWSTTIKAVIDGLIYALITAGTFGALWPR